MKSENESGEVARLLQLVEAHENAAVEWGRSNGEERVAGTLMAARDSLTDALRAALTPPPAPNGITREAVRHAYIDAANILILVPAGEQFVDELHAALLKASGESVAAPPAPHPECAGPFVDAIDCPVHRKDVLGVPAPHPDGLRRLSFAGSACVYCGAIMGEALKCPDCGHIDPPTRRPAP